MREITLYKIIILLLMLILFVGMGEKVVHAGNIDTGGDGSAYAYGENIGWINLNPSYGGGVTVTDSALSGFAWGENIGWVSFSCLSTSTCGTVNYGVVNDGAGNLSGYAWGENVGWINFAPTSGGITINPTSGVFSGYAWGENVGWISFASEGPVPFNVKTSWREATNPTANSNGASSYFSEGGYNAYATFDVKSLSSTPSGSLAFTSSKTRRKVVATGITSLSVTGKTAVVTGPCTLNGTAGYSFSATVGDNATPGSRADTFNITVTGPNSFNYKASGTIISGDYIVSQ